eukprot:TRINITY_DN12414_c0_g1::TRINITY_DN12414_c0_g1_i1::g.5007::m.5007 TRINITY_DN12414_c0_g1::TRINITY_DN12414_c0_g1_i1::g.5007  ORF type:complete len:346 (-),score=5.13 TRINITY_DN12414_c0_g1_i1:686-1723(-)
MSVSLCKCAVCHRLEQRSLSDLQTTEQRQRLIADLVRGLLAAVSDSTSIRTSGSPARQWEFRKTFCDYGWTKDTQICHTGRSPFTCTIGCFIKELRLRYKLDSETNYFTFFWATVEEVYISKKLFQFAREPKLVGNMFRTSIDELPVIDRKNRLSLINRLIHLDCFPESVLFHTLVEGMPLFPSMPYIHDWEWELLANDSMESKGKIIYTNGRGVYIVVTLKYVDYEDPDPSLRVSDVRIRRANQRKFALDLAIDARNEFRKVMPSALVILAAAFTNDQHPEALIWVNNCELLACVSAEIDEMNAKEKRSRIVLPNFLNREALVGYLFAALILLAVVLGVEHKRL